MQDKQTYYPVNWVDGMKIGKQHFIAQDNAVRNALLNVSSLAVDPLRFGILPVFPGDASDFNIKISTDNQGVVRVTILNCVAITPGGAFINVGTASDSNQKSQMAFELPLDKSQAGTWWIALLTSPYQGIYGGPPDAEEFPPRLPFVMPSYTMELVHENQYKQYSTHPYAIFIGKLKTDGNDVQLDDEFIPPCFALSSHIDLISLHAELDKFFGLLESKCSQIIQKIYSKKQQNELSELVLFLCDRIVLHLGQAIPDIRWKTIHQPPVGLFIAVMALARVMKNSIDLRIGSGKDEMLSYFSEWCELKQGELETLLTQLAILNYDHNDINANVAQVVSFVKTSTRLFDTLSKLDFIGKRKESGIFVKEETIAQAEEQNRPRRRFFG